MAKQFLLASDFDQTLSFNDSGVVLSELIGFHGFHDKVAGLSQMNLVQQGAELSYLILHDPEFRRVRRDDLIETGKRIRLKHDVALFARALDNLADDYKFSFYVISAAPQEIIQSALEGIVPPNHIVGTRFRYNDATGEAKYITKVARRTVLSDNAMSVLVPVLEEVLRWDSVRIRRMFASYGLTLREWDKTRTDMLTIQDSALPIPVG